MPPLRAETTFARSRLSDSSSHPSLATSCLPRPSSPRTHGSATRPTMPAKQPGRPPDLAASSSSLLATPIPPAVARVRSDAVWDGQGKGKGRASDCAEQPQHASLARPAGQVPPPPPRVRREFPFLLERSRDPASCC